MFSRLANVLTRDTGSAVEDALGAAALFVLLVTFLALPGLA